MEFLAQVQKAIISLEKTLCLGNTVNLFEYGKLSY
jgi:hypothetical protein